MWNFEMLDLESSDEYTLVGKRATLYASSVGSRVEVKGFGNDGAFPSHHKEIIFNEMFLDFIKFNKWDITNDISLNIQIGKRELSQEKVKKLESLLKELRDLFGLYNEYNSNYVEQKSSTESEDEI